MENNFLNYISNNNPAAVKTMIVIAVVKTKLQVIQENKPSCTYCTFYTFFLNKCICDIIIIKKKTPLLGDFNFKSVLKF